MPGVLILANPGFDDGGFCERRNVALNIGAQPVDRCSGDDTRVAIGIERFSRRQKNFADKIRAETRDIRALQDAPNPDQAKIEELANVINWDTRIFEDQRRTITYVCEVPVAIERRLGALARAIQQALE